MSYLGYIVGGGQVKPDGGKVKAVHEFPTPTTKTEVQSFLQGLSRYYRKFIPDYSTLAAPLTDLTKKCWPNKVIWSEECKRRFQKLKASLCSYPVLCSPDFNQPFTVRTDASNRGIGAVLTQNDENNEEHPIVYISVGSCCLESSITRWWKRSVLRLFGRSGPYTCMAESLSSKPTIAVCSG